MAVTPNAVRWVDQHVTIGISSSGDNAIITGLVGYQIVITSVFLASNGVQVQIVFKSGSTVILPAVEVCGAGEPTAFNLDENRSGHVVTNPGDNFVINLNGADTVNGELVYHLI